MARIAFDAPDHVVKALRRKAHEESIKQDRSVSMAEIVLRALQTSLKPNGKTPKPVKNYTTDPLFK